MKQLVETIAKELVDFPDKVEITEREEERAIILELQVAPEDMGKVIGKQGRVAKAIRSIIKSASQASVKKYVLEIME
ncbi:MAG: hypothetical protein BEN18_01855 [Epulopiscium sp. Nuni2H_MBin001]|nr:MAG: hypothetical protein BEN18_01855 [Epulopiscium sp. Nuni2H_MBin001]